MGYDVKLMGTAGGSGEADAGQAQFSESLAEALEQAERMAAQADRGEAVIYDRAHGSGAGTEIARYSASGGWSSEAITPVSWWSRLSMPTKEKLKTDPYGDVGSEMWREIAEAGGPVIGIPRPGSGGGGSAFRLPREIADFVESERPKL
ncbi:hypothetical protein [Arthrobacter mobilis]|uniref:Uncharacterized protein n=1 Tax=Arthrobacter mobilis TaxID=2724944 RepID=A0A7X6K4U8_9MICC|nr:hypothetical protein [Arthrobacter mobilis]NKX55747.1 hypothetical protein [Arthrobacter mobilis]